MMMIGTRTQANSQTQEDTETVQCRRYSVAAKFLKTEEETGT